MKRTLIIIAAVLGCVLLVLAAVPGYFIYRYCRNLHRHPFGDLAEQKENFDTLARIVDENRALIETYPAASGVGGRYLELSADGNIHILAYPQVDRLPLTDEEKQAVASIRSRYGGYYNLCVYDGGFLLMGDGESNLFSVLAHAENRRALRKMIAGKPFDRHIVKLSEQWFCVFERFGSAF